ncbi:hypothetical protein M0804_013712 [Polistes exclamans]|nr:hypothetical protein M0804_013712 [Polistes exclamans]
MKIEHCSRMRFNNSRFFFFLPGDFNIFNSSQKAIW